MARAYLFLACLSLASFSVISAAAVTNADIYDLLKDNIEGMNFFKRFIGTFS